MNDIISHAKNKKKLFKAHDVPKIKHWCIMIYGYDWWKTVDLNEVFEQLPLIQEEVIRRERADDVREVIAKQLGAKIKKR